LLSRAGDVSLAEKSAFQARGFRIVPDVIDLAAVFFGIPDDSRIGVLIPYGTRPPRDLVDGMCRNAFPSGYYRPQRRIVTKSAENHMDVIRHDAPDVQGIFLAIVMCQNVPNGRGDVFIPQEARTISG